MSSRVTYDVAVVGLGAMGSAAAWQLARRGARVVGIDQYRPPHSLGSTHGDSRVTRVATAEGEAYVPLAARSHELWREVEAEAGVELFDACGVLMAGPASGAAGLHGVDDWVGTTIELARGQGVEHEVLSGAEAERRFPMFRLHGDSVAYFEPGGGYVRPERAVAAQLRLAEQCGAELRFDQPVLEIAPTSDGVDIVTSAGRLHADHVVLGVGAWLPGFMDGATLAASFTVRRQVLHWFEIAPQWVERVEPGDCPVYICAFGSRAEDCFYGFPAIDGIAAGMKVASEQTTASTTPETVDREVADAESTDLYERLVRPRLRALTDRCLRSVVCLYTVTPDAGFVIDAHPELDRVTLVSACSGHGFKHSAAIGEALAQRLLDGHARLDLAPFAMAP